MPFNSNKDRHEKLGLGSIGIDGIKNIVLNDRIKDIPLYLETPNELDGYMEEIKLIKNLRGE
jgi:deoxyribonuclease-4